MRRRGGWSSERAIVRDLSRAQGAAARAPPPPPRALHAAERPPRRAVADELAREQRACAAGGGGGGPPRPDLALIRRMLDMVREWDISEDDADVGDAAPIERLDPRAPEFIPSSSVKVAPVCRKGGETRRIRNVAMESILRLAGAAPPADLDPELVEEDDTVEKVKQRSTDGTETESTNMFKKKIQPPPAPGAAAAPAPPPRPRRAGDERHVPGAAAARCLRRYLARARAPDPAGDGIGTDADKQMKLIEGNRRPAAVADISPRPDDELAKPEEEPAADENTGAGEEARRARSALENEAGRVLSGWAAVRLPAPRHAPGPPPGAPGAAGAGGREGAPCPVCAALQRWRAAAGGAR